MTTRTAAISLPWRDTTAASMALPAEGAAANVHAHAIFASKVAAETLRAFARSPLGDVAFLSAAGQATEREAAFALFDAARDMELVELASERRALEVVRAVETGVAATAAALGDEEPDTLLLVGAEHATPPAQAFARAAAAAQIRLLPGVRATAPDYASYLQTARMVQLDDRQLCLPLAIDASAEEIRAQALTVSGRHECTRLHIDGGITEPRALARLTDALTPLVADRDLDLHTSCTLSFMPSPDEAQRLRDAGVMAVHLAVSARCGRDALTLLAAVRDLKSFAVDVSWEIGGEAAEALDPAIPALAHLPPPSVQPTAPARRAAELVRAWRAGHAGAGLVARSGPGYTELVDTRGRRDRIITLIGIQAEVYAACSQPRRAVELVDAFAGRAPRDKLAALFSTLIAEGMLAATADGWLLAPGCRSAQGRQPQHDRAIRVALAADPAPAPRVHAAGR